MALYERVPEEKMAAKTKKKVTSKRQRSQMPGHPADEPRGLAETPAKKSAKAAPPFGKAVSKPLDTKNKGGEVGGKGGSRDTVAPSARKASTPSPKPKGTDKKVRGQVKK